MRWVSCGGSTTLRARYRNMTFSRTAVVYTIRVCGVGCAFSYARPWLAVDNSPYRSSSCVEKKHHQVNTTRYLVLIIHCCIKGILLIRLRRWCRFRHMLRSTAVVAHADRTNIFENVLSHHLHQYSYSCIPRLPAPKAEGASERLFVELNSN